MSSKPKSRPSTGSTTARIPSSSSKVTQRNVSQPAGKSSSPSPKFYDGPTVRSGSELKAQAKVAARDLKVTAKQQSNLAVARVKRNKWSIFTVITLIPVFLAASLFSTVLCPPPSSNPSIFSRYALNSLGVGSKHSSLHETLCYPANVYHREILEPYIYPVIADVQAKVQAHPVYTEHFEPGYRFASATSQRAWNGPLKPVVDRITRGARWFYYTYVQPHVPYVKAKFTEATAPVTLRAQTIYAKNIQPHVKVASSYACAGVKNAKANYRTLAAHPLTKQANKHAWSAYSVGKKNSYKAYLFGKPHALTAWEKTQLYTRNTVVPATVEGLKAAYRQISQLRSMLFAQLKSLYDQHARQHVGPYVDQASVVLAPYTKMAREQVYNPYIVPAIGYFLPGIAEQPKSFWTLIADKLPSTGNAAQNRGSGLFTDSKEKVVASAKTGANKAAEAKRAAEAEAARVLKETEAKAAAAKKAAEAKAAEAKKAAEAEAAKAAKVAEAEAAAAKKATEEKAAKAAAGAAAVKRHAERQAAEAEKVAEKKLAQGERAAESVASDVYAATDSVKSAAAHETVNAAAAAQSVKDKIASHAAKVAAAAESKASEVAAAAAQATEQVKEAAGGVKEDTVEAAEAAAAAAAAAGKAAKSKPEAVKKQVLEAEDEAEDLKPRKETVPDIEPEVVDEVVETIATEKAKVSGAATDKTTLAKEDVEATIAALKKKIDFTAKAGYGRIQAEMIKNAEHVVEIFPEMEKIASENIEREASRMVSGLDKLYTRSNTLTRDQVNESLRMADDKVSKVAKTARDGIRSKKDGLPGKASGAVLAAKAELKKLVGPEYEALGKKMRLIDDLPAKDWAAFEALKKDVDSWTQKYTEVTTKPVSKQLQEIMKTIDRLLGETLSGLTDQHSNFRERQETLKAAALDRITAREAVNKEKAKKQNTKATILPVADNKGQADGAGLAGVANPVIGKAKEQVVAAAEAAEKAAREARDEL